MTNQSDSWDVTYLPIVLPKHHALPILPHPPIFIIISHQEVGSRLLAVGLGLQRPCVGVLELLGRRALSTGRAGRVDEVGQRKVIRRLGKRVGPFFGGVVAAGVLPFFKGASS